MLLPHSPPSICTIHSFVWFLLENVETFMRFFAFCLCYNKSLWFYAILRLLLILVVVSVFIRFYERHSYYFLIVAFSSLAGYAPKPKHLLITTKPKKMKINKVEKCSQFFFTFSSPTNWNCYGGLFLLVFYYVYVFYTIRSERIALTTIATPAEGRCIAQCTIFKSFCRKNGE